MKTLALGLALAAALLQPLPAAAAATLAAYRSEAEFNEALARWQQRARERQVARRAEASPTFKSADMAAAPAPAAAAQAMGKALADSAAESITNVQTAGVDEGGIVKQAGEHLVVLRRGRLFTLRVGGDQLQPVASVPAWAPGSSPRGAWYDELLLSGRDVVVIGYSYARGGTEIGLFRLGDDGSLAYRATWHLKSGDYYSARNYASRLIGRQLVFYSPMVLHAGHPQPWNVWPALRRWRPDAVPEDFQRLLPATRIWRSDDDFDPAQPLALHSVTRCDLDAPDLACRSSAVLGPVGREFYVAAESVYVWAGGARWQPQAVLFRLPLDGAAPSGIKATGTPVDQLSFLEDAGHLNVLLRGGDSGAGTALLRLPLSALGDGTGSAQREHYRRLPDGAVQHNRYVGDWLLWGGGSSAWAMRYALPQAEPQRLEPGHAVQRIEALGRGHAVLVGNAGADLHFSALRLGEAEAQPAGRHVRPQAAQGETRSHGFFYRPTGEATGLLGLPVLADQRPRGAVYHGAQGAAAVAYLRHQGGELRPLGELVADGSRLRDDGCQASCVDWYGNARPIFLGTRVFALMGYELVEGRLADSPFGRERIDERRRVNFAPGAARGGRWSPFD